MNLPLATAMMGEHLLTITSTSLEVVEVSNPAAPMTISGMPIPNGPIDEAAAAVSGSLLYAIYSFDDENGSALLQAIDLTDASNPKVAGTLAGRWDAADIAVTNHVAYIGGGPFGLHIIDVAAPANMKELAAVDLDAVSVAVDGRYGYVADASGSVVVLDLRDLSAPQRIASIEIPAGQVRLFFPLLYVVSDTGLSIVDVANPAKPRRISGNSAFSAQRIAITPSHLYVAGQNEWIALDQIRFAHLEILRPSSTGIALRLHALPMADWIIQNSADSKTWSNWQRISGQSEPVLLTDPAPGGSRQRFYRAVAP